KHGRGAKTSRVDPANASASGHHQTDRLGFNLSADIVITEDLDSPALRRLTENHSVAIEPMLWKDLVKMRALLTEARCVIIRNQTSLTRDLLSSAGKLLAIGRVGVGLDNIDVKAASELGIVV